MENDKDLKEMLKSMENILKILNDSDLGKAKERLSDMLEEAIKEPAVITIKKDSNGKAETNIEGRGLALLITLAGLEKTILRQIGASEREFSFIKNFVGTMEAEDNE